MLRRAITMLVFLFAVAYASTAFAAYQPLLVSPTNGASAAPDGTTFSWMSGGTQVDGYRAQFSLDSGFSSVFFEYDYDSTTTSKVVSGLPGSSTIYWRVGGLAEGSEYWAAYRSLNTTSDGESSTNYALNDDFANGISSAWTVSNSSYIRSSTAGNGGGCAQFRFSRTYSTLNFNMMRTVDIPAVPSYLRFDVGHDYDGYSERMYVELSEDNGATWTRIALLQNSSPYWDTNENENTAPRTAADWATPTYPIPASALGKTVQLRFRGYIPRYTYYPQYAYIDDVQIYYTGKTLEVSSDHGAPSPSGVYSDAIGTVVSASVDQSVADTIDENRRYYCIGWTGTGSVPVTGDSNSVDVYLYRHSTLTWNWETQYELTVTSVDDRGIISPYGAHWVASGTQFTITNSTPIWNIGSTTTRLFNHQCVGTGVFSGTTPFQSGLPEHTISVTVDESGTLEFQWINQYKVTITNPDMHGTPEPLVGEHWYKDGEGFSFNIEPIIYDGSGTAYECIGWNGTGSIDEGDRNYGSAAITSASTLEWLWHTKFYIWIISQFGKTGGDEAGWYVADTFLNVNCEQYHYVNDDVRWESRDWTASGSLFDGIGRETGDFRIIAPTTIEFNWYKQYRIVVFSNYGQTMPEGRVWADDGEDLTVSAVQPSNTDTMRFTWNGWVGATLPSTPSGGTTTTITVTGVGSYTALWTASFLVTVTSSNGTFAANYDGWYVEGTDVSVEALPPASGVDARYVSGWTGTGNGAVNLAASDDHSDTQTITVNSPIEQEVYWVRQVSLEILVPQGITGTYPPVGISWFFIGDLAQGYAPFDVNGVRCTGFTGSGSAPATSSKAWFSFVITSSSVITFEYELPSPAPEYTFNAPRLVGAKIGGDVLAVARKSDGSPVIIFHDPIAGTLEAAYSLSGIWYAQVIDEIGSADTDVDLVLDSFDVPHVLYHDPLTSQLKYGFLDTNLWRTRTIASMPGSGRYLSLAIDRFDKLYATYYNNEDGSLNITYPTDSKSDSKNDNWTNMVLDDQGNVGMFCSVTLSELWSEPYISYYDATNGQLKLAHYDHLAETWVFETVPYDGDLGRNTSIVVDSSGRPAIACQENSVNVNEQGLVFAIRRDNGWQTYPLDEQGVTGFHPEMAIDESGNFHISYHDYADLYYARFNGVTWSVNKITDGAALGEDTALALDENGYPAIIFWDGGDLNTLTPPTTRSPVP
ncbi:MAG: hypothetical protein U5N86_04840 [Planctomycetota bacterium]|nr:hypothetical protein [Planctomycetota bacterium]